MAFRYLLVHGPRWSSIAIHAQWASCPPLSACKLSALQVKVIQTLYSRFAILSLPAVKLTFQLFLQLKTSSLFCPILVTDLAETAQSAHSIQTRACFSWPAFCYWYWKQWKALSPWILKKGERESAKVGVGLKGGNLKELVGRRRWRWGSGKGW